jgi:hypothetical protein
MRGLSGAVTALILVVASVIIALIVVGFAFNMFGSYSTAGAVSPVGTAYMYTTAAPYGIAYNSSDVYLVVTLNNRGPNVNITSATINGMSATPYQVYIANTATNTATLVSGVYVPPGQNTLVIVFKGINPSYVAGSPVNVELTLGNGQTIYVAASLVG